MLLNDGSFKDITYAGINNSAEEPVELCRPSLRCLLQKTCRLVARHPRKRLTERECDRLQRHYRALLTRGAQALSPIPSQLSGQQGRDAKSDAHNL